MLIEPKNPIPSHYEPKTTWRAWAKAQRSFVCSSFAGQQQAQQAMLKQLQLFIENNPTFETIGLYLPMPLEPDLLTLLTLLPNKQWVLPRVGQTALGEETTQLLFHVLPLALIGSSSLINSIETPLIQTPWGLWEPPASWHQPTRLDLLIIPALAMDGMGIRLGYGGGYFDRWLALQSQQPYTIGVCWAACKVAQLPKNEFDVPLSAVCTEEGLFFGS